jgi:PDZ domain-containing protein
MRPLRFARYVLPVGLFLLISICQRLPWLTLYLPAWMEPITRFPQVLGISAWGLTAVVALVKGPGRKRHLVILILSILALGASLARWAPVVGLLVLGLLGAAILDPFLVLKEEGRSPAWGALPVLLAIGIFTLCNRTTGAYLTKPGGVFHMHEIVQVEGGKDQDEILALYVNIQPETLLDRLLNLVQPTERIPREEVTALASGLGNELRAETQQMAMAVALQKLGRGRGANPQPFVQVEAVNAAGPSAKLLLPGDQIQTVNGQTFTDLTSLRGYLRQQSPETPLHLSLLRKGETIETAVTLGHRPDDPAVAYLGVTLQTPFAYDIPVHYTASSRGSGNSYGAIFALTVLDQLTPGGITGGHVVAGTGTIEADGSVGLVGSVRLKAFVAARSGADVMFVPMAEVNDARAGAGSRLEVVPVRTLQEMVDWLKAHPLKT